VAQGIDPEFKPSTAKKKKRKEKKSVQAQYRCYVFFKYLWSMIGGIHGYGTWGYKGLTIPENLLIISQTFYCDPHFSVR
jgi:thiamine transporter ThiT